MVDAPTPPLNSERCRDAASAAAVDADNCVRGGPLADVDSGRVNCGDAYAPADVVAPAAIAFSIPAATALRSPLTL